MTSWETQAVIFAGLLAVFVGWSIWRGVIVVAPSKAVRKVDDPAQFWLFAVVQVVTWMLAVYLVLLRP